MLRVKARSVPPTKNVSQTNQQGQTTQRFGAVPLSFERNEGQTDEAVKFLLRAKDFTTFFTQTEAVFVLASPLRTRNRYGRSKAIIRDNQTTNAGEGSSSLLRMSFKGANPSAKIDGLDELEGHVNYYVGRDPSRWRTDIATFARVRYESIYPGIDLVYYSKGGDLEYDFILSPGADHSRIALAFEAANDVTLDAAGNLVLKMEAGEVVQRAPVAYQEIAGVRHNVSAAFVLEQKSVRFRIGDYDHTYPLIIDPVVRYSTYLGGSRLDEPQDIAVDAFGSAHIAGTTKSSNFPRGTEVEEEAVFVSMFNPAGTALVFTTIIDGEDFEFGHSIAVDASRNSYVTGFTRSNKFPVTLGAFQPHRGAGGLELFPFDAFLAKLNVKGQLVYSTYLGGDDDDIGFGVAVDSRGRAHVTGITCSQSFPLRNAFDDDLATAGGCDAFLTVFGGTGEALAYSTFLGGRDQESSEYDTGFDVAVDAEGNSYVTGQTGSTDFPIKAPTGSIAFQPTHQGREDAFVVKIDPTASGGPSLIYSTYIGGAADDNAFAIAVDHLNRAYITGQTFSTDFPLKSVAGASVIDPSNVDGDAFVINLNALGSAAFFSTYLGGTGVESGTGIAVDAGRNIYVTGTTDSGNFGVINPFQPKNAVPGVEDAFIAKLSASGRKLLYSSYLGGSGVEDLASVSLDPEANVYVAGLTHSNNFPVKAGAFQGANAGDGDGFITKIATTNLDTVGVYRASTSEFLLQNSSAANSTVLVQSFGINGDIPLKGDWNGDDVETIGFYRPATAQFFLNNQNTDPIADQIISFGQSGDVPIAGDWNADGIDTIGVYRPSTGEFLLRNSNSSGPPDFSFTFGQTNSTPVVGDWDGDGDDTIGTFNAGVWSLRNSNSAGAPSIAPFVFGDQTGDLPVTGDWDGDSVVTPGIFRAGEFLLNNRNDDSGADLIIGFGVNGDTPLGGDWDGRP